jgi:amidophosphoribosyltransferase
MRIGSPAIKAPCYLGVDMPTREERIASNRIEDEVRHKITATTLHHISIVALINAIGKDREDLCTGCLTGCYPLAIEGEQVKMRQIDFVDATYQSKLGSFSTENT